MSRMTTLRMQAAMMEEERVSMGSVNSIDQGDHFKLCAFQNRYSNQIWKVVFKAFIIGRESSCKPLSVGRWVDARFDQ